MWAGRRGVNIVIEPRQVGKTVGKEWLRLLKTLKRLSNSARDGGQCSRHPPLIDGPSYAEPLDYLHKASQGKGLCCYCARPRHLTIDG